MKIIRPDEAPRKEKILLIIAVSMVIYFIIGMSKCGAQTIQKGNTFSKMMFSPKGTANLDSLMQARFPAHPDSTKVPKGTKFYDFLIVGIDGKVAAYKIHNKPWKVVNSQNTLNSIMLSLFYYIKPDTTKH